MEGYFASIILQYFVLGALKMTQHTIKSFVLRAGRMSNRQQQALDNWLVDYELLQPESPWCFDKIFGRVADTVVEIGYGMGDSLAKMAAENININYLGLEVHRPGIGSLVADLHDNNISNVRIATFDAVDVFKNCIADDSLSGVQIFFPDPWPKKRHNKRRLIQPDFISLLAKKIKVGGFIHCATDWQDYATEMLECLSAEKSLVNNQVHGGFFPRPDSRPLTKFEKRGLRLGHGVWDLIFVRK